jgi:hypothetical protein
MKEVVFNPATKEEDIVTQRDRIRKHLLSGRSITPMDALRDYGTLSLQYHIFTLRQEGLDIETRFVTAFSGQRYAEYKLRPVYGKA